MTTRAIQEFLERANSDEGLREELRALVEGPDETALDALTALAAKHGFEFSVEELNEALDRVHERDLGGELTERDLEKVAGGTTIQSISQLFSLTGGSIDDTSMLRYMAPPPDGDGVTVRYAAPPPDGDGVTVRYAAPPGG